MLGVLAAEGVARAVAPPGGAHLTFNAPDGEPDNLVQPDGELRTALRPGFSGTVRLPGLSVLLRVNTLGMRGAEVEPPSGVPRWLVVGDSFTFAAQVPEQDTFVSRLGEITGTEVFNGGVDGDSTWQSSRRYLRVAPQVQPDGVILVYFLGNDPQDNERFTPSAPVANPRPAPAREKAPQLEPRLRPWESFLFEHSFLYAHWRVWSRTRDLSGRGAGDVHRWRGEMELFTTRGAGALRNLLPRTEAAFAELAELTAERGDRLVVALAPPVYSIDVARLPPTLEMVGLDPASGSPDAVGDAVAGVLAKQGIASCDLAPALRQAQAAGESPYLQFDGHWSVQGHATVAAALKACLDPSSAPPPR